MGVDGQASGGESRQTKGNSRKNRLTCLRHIETVGMGVEEGCWGGRVSVGNWLGKADKGKKIHGKVVWMRGLGGVLKGGGTTSWVGRLNGRINRQRVFIGWNVPRIHRAHSKTADSCEGKGSPKRWKEKLPSNYGDLLCD